MAYRILVTIGCSEGRRLLLELLQRTPGVQVAERADVVKSTVSQWAQGDRVPEYARRRALFEEFLDPDGRVGPGSRARRGQPRAACGVRAPRWLTTSA